MTPVRVSVVIPCFDLGAYLDEALDSVSAQTLTSLEVIVVDDGSTDPVTVARLAEPPRDPRVRVLRVAHGGVCAARNHGLAAARGEYVCFLDADDRLRPRCLEKAVARLDAEPALAFVSFWVELFGDESWIWQPTSCDATALLSDCCVATAAVARRAAVEAVGGFEAAMELGHEDWDLWLSLVARGFRGAILPEVLFDYRRRAGSRSAIADDDAVYLEMLRARFRKHEALHREHLRALLLRSEAAARAHAQATPPAALEWAVQRRRAEVERLRASLLAHVRRLPAERPAGGLASLASWLRGRGNRG